MNEAYEALKRRQMETYEAYRKAMRANHRSRSTEDTRQAVAKAKEAYSRSTAEFNAATALRDAVAVLTGFGIVWRDLLEEINPQCGERPNI